MKIIYQPKGRALEYSPLACNQYMGCTHGCKYCYAQGCMRTSSLKWMSNVYIRKDVLENFEKDARKIENSSKRILFSFLSDPYQPIEKEHHITRKCLELVAKYNLQSSILTKGSRDLIEQDFDLYHKARTQLGITISFSKDETRQQWEPNASTIHDRLELLKEAHKDGIYTWVSLEPVIDPKEALEVLHAAHPYVSFWKIGKLNHNKTIEKQVDWKRFLLSAKTFLNEVHAKYYIKKDLAKLEQM